MNEADKSKARVTLRNKLKEELKLIKPETSVTLFVQRKPL